MFRCVAAVPPSVLNPLVDCVKFVEGLETRYDASTTRIPRLEPISVGGTYEKGQGGVKGLNEGGGLTIVDTVHVERPPSNFLMPIEPLAVEVFDPGDFAPKMLHDEVKGLMPSVVNLSVGCMNFFEGAEIHHNEWVVLFMFFYCLVLFWATWSNRKGQVNAESLYRGCGLILDGVAHLLRPPGCVFNGGWLMHRLVC
jgi:hypothetical protein